METTILLWSASTASQERQQEAVGTGSAYLPHNSVGTAVLPPKAGVDLEPSTEQLPVQEASAPRASKKKKHAAAPKRPPQRGLGVEKLERLRLQEKWRKMTEIEQPMDGSQMHASPGAGDFHEHHPQQLLLHYAAGAQGQAPHSPFGVCNGFPVYDPQHQAGVSRMALARFAAAPVGYGGTWEESCLLHRHTMPSFGRILGNCGTISAVKPAAFQDPSGADLFRLGAVDTKFQVTSRLSELPSSQSLQCSEECDICIRKRMLEERLWINGGIDGSAASKPPLCHLGAADRKSGDPEGHVTTTQGGRLEVKEFEFFPCSSSCSTSNGINHSSSDGDTTWDTRTTAGAVPSTITSASACRSKQLDLTLKLSCS